MTVTLGLSSVFTGHTTNATATARKADGTTEVVAATWSSDRTTVATVSPTGLVTAVGSGTANIVASYQGLTGSAPFSVTPDFSGTWRGTLRFASCEGFGDPRTCGHFNPVGTTGDMTLVFTQDGNGVQGTFDFTYQGTYWHSPAYHFWGTLSGVFDAEGVLSMQGRSPSGSNWIPDWRTKIVGGTQEGSFSQVWPPVEHWDKTGIISWDSLALKK